MSLSIINILVMPQSYPFSHPNKAVSNELVDCIVLIFLTLILVGTDENRNKRKEFGTEQN